MSINSFEDLINNENYKKFKDLLIVKRDIFAMTSETFPEILQELENAVKNGKIPSYYLLSILHMFKVIRPNLQTEYNKMEQLFSKILPDLWETNEYENSRMKSFTYYLWTLFHNKGLFFFHEKHAIQNDEVLNMIKKDQISEFINYTTNHPLFDCTQLIKKRFNSYSYFPGSYNYIEYAAFCGAVNCFKYLLLYECDISNIVPYAICGGNLEIVRICMQNRCNFENMIEFSIAYHRYDIFYWLLFNFKNGDYSIPIIKSNNEIAFASMIDLTTYYNLNFITNNICYPNKIIASAILNNFHLGKADIIQLFNAYLLYGGIRTDIVDLFFKTCPYMNDSIERLFSNYVSKALPLSDVVTYFIERVTDINKGNYLHILCGRNNCNNIIKIFIKHGADVNKEVNGKTPLFIACDSFPTIELIKLLLDNGADINKGLQTPLTALCSKCVLNEELITYLIENGADLNAGIDSPLSLLCKMSNVSEKLIKKFVDKGADVNRGIYPPLYNYCKLVRFNTNLVKYLVEHGANVNGREHYIPLIALISQEFNIPYSTIKYLIEQGADPHKQSSLGISLIKYALRKRDVELLHILSPYISDKDREEVKREDEIERKKGEEAYQCCRI